jgi:hypothetical protein
MSGRSVPVAVLALFALAGAGCGGKTAALLAPNAPPELRLAPAIRTSSAFELSWTSSDPDGRVVSHRYAIDPPSLDRLESATWITVAERRLVVSFGGRPLPPGRDAHMVALQAIDDDGAVSATRWFAVQGENLPPYVEIVSPPASVIPLMIPPAVTIHWEGGDPDGVTSQEPVQYKYRLIPDTSDDFTLTLSFPDSLRRRDAPAFAGWDSVPGETTSVHFTNLVPGHDYLFVVVAIDEGGAHTMPFTYHQLLRLRVTFENVSGPVITVYTDAFHYTYPSGGYDPAQEPIRVEVAAAVPLAFRWIGTPQPGLEIRRHRWVLDPEDLFDQTPRSGPDDLGHWSDWSDAVPGEAVLPAFDTSGPKRERHHLWIEIEDEVGLRSLAHVEMIVVPATPSADLLIVDDTRLRPDHYQGLCRMHPSGTFPTAAELDTLLFARGGFPISYGCQVLGTSTPGLFSGFDYDTIGTRGLRESVVPLSTLSQYRNVIWLTDGAGATRTQPWYSPIDPITGLRSMSRPGGVNVLATYLQMGGHVWVAGGGAAFASSYAFNDPSNDSGGRFVFSSVSSPRELMPGRFMWTMGWRSELSVLFTNARIDRWLGRHEGDPAFAGAPLTIQWRSAETDPLPPGRANPSTYYTTTSSVEFLQRPEGWMSDPPELDTLYRMRSPVLIDNTPGPPKYPMMTRYRSPEWGGSAVFSGFSLWSYQNGQVRELIDFVLEDLWGLQRVASAPAKRRSRRARVRSSRGAGRAPALRGSRAPS